MLLEVIHTDIDKNILSQILQWLMILIPLTIQTINLHPHDSAVGAGRARDWGQLYSVTAPPSRGHGPLLQHVVTRSNEKTGALMLALYLLK